MKERIEALMKDADERRKIEDETVMMWLRELYSLALDAEDLLDMVLTRRKDPSRQQQQNGQAAPTTAPGRNKRKRGLTWNDLLSSSAYQCSSYVPQLLFNRLVAKEADAINSELNEITDRKKKLRLQRGDAARGSTARDPPPTAAASIQLVGMVSDKQTIITLLLQDDPQLPPTRVVAIKGIGGSGKTATAQSAYHDEMVVKFFDERIWVDVERNHGAETITIEMLESLGERSSFCNFDTSLRRLKELVSNKKVLVVLDNTEGGFLPYWDTMRATLSAAARESTVLVTTTSNEVARSMGATTHQLRGLSEDEWLQLFMSKTGDFSGYPRLPELARKIGQRCQLSPFAAKSLGSLMSSSRDAQEWVAVLGIETHQGTPDEGGKEILRMLRRSYEFLPLHLKRCFAFCAIFPDDHNLDMVELAKIWVALGFIEGDPPLPEVVGDRYFRQLEAKSFFEVLVRRDGETLTEQNGRYKIPRLMHDLARSVSADECLAIGNENHDAISKDVRHLLLNCSRLGTEMELLDSFLQKSDHRRTFIMLQCLNTLPTDLFLKMPCLRVLDISCTGLYNLPESTGELKLLRYLNLFYTNITKLPDSVTCLHNLQILNLGDCYFLHELPKETSKLTNLRHLDLRLSHPRRSSLASMPPDIGKLTRLETLSRFIAGKKSQGCGIDQLQHIKNINGELWLSNLENVDADAARTVHLADKEGIRTLTLEWTTLPEAAPLHSDSNHNPIRRHPDSRPPRKEQTGPENSSSSTSTASTTVPNPPSSVQNHHNTRVANSVIEQLHPPPYLETLRIDGFSGNRLPEWMRQMTQLQTVTLRNMTNLAEWPINHAQMPQLRELHFFNCPKLRDPRSLFPHSVNVQIKPEIRN